MPQPLNMVERFRRLEQSIEFEQQEMRATLQDPFSQFMEHLHDTAFQLSRFQINVHSLFDTRKMFSLNGRFRSSGLLRENICCIGICIK
jgi:hypothetical protein